MMLRQLAAYPSSHRPYYMCVPGQSGIILMASEDGACTLLSNDLRQLKTLRLDATETNRIGWIELSPDGALVAVGYGEYFVVHNFARLAAGVDAPASARRFDVAETHGCVFMDGGRIVCVAGAAPGEDEPTLYALGVHTGEMDASHPLPGPDAYYHVLPHPEGEALAIVNFSGQSEEWLYWGHYRRATLRAFDRPEIVDAVAPQFHPAGGECLTAHEKLGLARVEFPSGRIIASAEGHEAFAAAAAGAPDDAEDEDDADDHHFGYDMFYAADDRAVVQEEGVALHLLDLNTMRSVQPILEGVGGWRYGDDRRYLGQFWRLPGDRMLTAESHHVGRDANHTLRLWDIAPICGRLTPVDPSRPFTRKLLEMMK